MTTLHDDKDRSSLDKLFSSFLLGSQYGPRLGARSQLTILLQTKLICGRYSVHALRHSKTKITSITLTIEKRVSKIDWNSQNLSEFDGNNQIRTSTEQRPVKQIQPIA